VFELGAKDQGLHARPRRVVGEEIAKVRIVAKRSAGYRGSLAQFSFAECALIEAKVFSHKGAS
jgi:hypothetical protein